MYGELRTDFQQTMVAGKSLYTKMLYFDHNDGEDTPVLVFLHEALGCTELWKDIPEKICMATGLDALVYDRIGNGLSSPTTEKRRKDYLHVEAFTYLAKLLERLNVENVILIGHSDGGSIGLLYASRYTHLVQGVVTLAAHAYVDEKTVIGIKDTVEKYEKGNDLKDSLMLYHGENTFDVFNNWSNTWLSPSFSDWNIEEDISTVKAPVLAIQGDKDEYGLVLQLESIADNIGKNKVQTMLVPNCGHAPHFQAQEKVLDAIVRFVNKVKVSY